MSNRPERTKPLTTGQAALTLGSAGRAVVARGLGGPQPRATPAPVKRERGEQAVRTAAATLALGIGHSRMSAIKRAMGLSGRKYVLLSDVKKWMRANPLFREQDIYHRSDCGCQECLLKRAAPSRATPARLAWYSRGKKAAV